MCNPFYKKFILLFSFLILAPFLKSQEITPNFWQQKVNYKIDVKLDDQNHFLNASEEIEYINNSPNELTFIYFHLWPNAYKNNHTAFAHQQLRNNSSRFYFSKREQKGYIDSLDFKVNSQTVKWEYDSIHIDICKIYLNEPLKSGKKITITTPFRVKIPDSFSRLGKTGAATHKHKKEKHKHPVFNMDEQSYQITQWYPKPAVFDTYGWHPIPYLDQGEFYSEYGSFDVKITVPRNYVVGSTGIMIESPENPTEKEWMEKREEYTKQCIRDSLMEGKSNLMEYLYKKNKTKKKRADSVAKSKLIFSRDFEKDNYKTLQFKQDNIHDFAFFLDKDFHVLSGEVELPHSKRKVKTYVMFTYKEAYLWKDALQYVNDAVYYYSLWNGDYPYDQCTAVEGALSAGGGMEYPMITIIGSGGSAEILENVIAHEVGHNWFYGILGSNERTFPWLDEGINSYYDNRYMEIKKAKKKESPEIIGSAELLKISKRAKNLSVSFGIKQTSQQFLMGKVFQFNASRNMDQPIGLHSEKYTNINYGVIVYGKTALVMNYLAAYLGQEKFDQCMKQYYKKWQFKHPHPEDIKQVFEEQTGQNLDWFFDDLINTKKQLDFSLTTCKKNENTFQIVVKNKGEIMSPTMVSSFGKTGNMIETKWTPPFSNKDTLVFKTDSVKSFKIDPNGLIPEVNQRNNWMRANGIFRKTEKLRLQPLFSLSDGDKTFLYYLPTSGYNTIDKFFVGSAFYNSVVPFKKVYYWAMPMYSFSENKWVGSGSVNWNIYPTGAFSRVRLGVLARSYSTMEKITPSVSLVVNPSHLRDSPLQKINFSYDLIRDYQKSNENRSIFIPRNIFQIYYLISNKDAVSRWDTKISVQHISNDTAHGIDYKVKENAIRYETSDFSIISITTDYKYQYHRKKSMYFRIYAGMLTGIDIDSTQYPLNIVGNNDYVFNENLIDRAGKSEFFSHQIIPNEGGFKINDATGFKNYLFSFNYKLEIPKLPLGLFMDFGVFGNADDNNYLDVIGVYLPVIKNMIEIYFPFYHFSDNKLFTEKNLGLYQLRFTMNLGSLSPWEMADEIR